MTFIVYNYMNNIDHWWVSRYTSNIFCVGNQAACVDQTTARKWSQYAVHFYSRCVGDGWINACIDPDLQIPADTYTQP